MKRLLSLLWASVVLLNFQVTAAPWRWSNPEPHGATIFDIASFGSLVVTVGEFGQVYTSDDLVEWMPRRTGVTNSLRSAAFFGAQLVVTASEGMILYTENDALSRFQKIDLGTSDWLEGLAVGNGQLVAVGDNGAIYTSTNVTNWERVAGAGDWLTSVAYGAGRFVAVGYGGYVTTSANGVNWTAQSRLGTNDLNGVKFLQDKFWILGNRGLVRVSDSGLLWTPVSIGTTNDLFDVATDGEQVAIIGRSELRTSTAPYLVWSSKLGDYPAPPLWTYYTAHFDGSEFMTAGRSGMFVEGFRTNTTSEVTWFSSFESPRNWLWSLTAVDGIFAASGEQGGIFTSVDGFGFTQEVVPAAAEAEILEGIGGTTNFLVSVGTAGTILYSPGGYTNVTRTNAIGEVTTEQVSLLGLVWKAVSPSPTTKELQGVGTFGNYYIVSGGGGTILTSTNMTNWNVRASGTTRMLSSIAASPTRVIAVGDIGALVTSENGTTWTLRNPGPVTNWIYQAKYLNDQFVAVGEAGLIITSPDGLAWTKRTSGTTVWLNAVNYFGGNYYAVGGQGVVLRSADSTNWARIPMSTSKSIYGIAANAQRMVTVGVEGAILRQRLPPFPMTPVNFLKMEIEMSGLVFLANGELDQPFTLMRSNDLQTWIPGPEYEILDPSGLLVFFEGLGIGDRSFYQTRLIEE